MGIVALFIFQHIYCAFKRNVSASSSLILYLAILMKVFISSHIFIEYTLVRLYICSAN